MNIKTQKDVQFFILVLYDVPCNPRIEDQVEILFSPPPPPQKKEFYGTLLSIWCSWGTVDEPILAFLTFSVSTFVRISFHLKMFLMGALPCGQWFLHQSYATNGRGS